VLCLIQEDTGIRYDLVTGVQTCALPIYTRERRAKATALSMRGTKPKRSPDSRNFSQRSSSSKMRTSTSRVNRGRPNKDAATPPMMRPETFSDWSHAIRAPSVISGGRTGGFLATVGPAELCPSSPHFFHSVRAGLPPTEVLSPSQKRVQLPELACNRCPPQLLFLF